MEGPYLDGRRRDVPGQRQEDGDGRLKLRGGRRSHPTHVTVEGAQRQAVASPVKKIKQSKVNHCAPLCDTLKLHS